MGLTKISRVFGAFLLVFLSTPIAQGGDSIRSCRDRAADDMLRCEAALQVAAGAAAEETEWWQDASELLNQRLQRPSRTGFGSAPESSSVVFGIKDTVPSPQKWSRCEFCALEVGDGAPSSSVQLKAVLFDPRSALGMAPPKRAATTEGPTLMSSKWKGFFHQVPEAVGSRLTASTFVDAIKGSQSAGDRCSRVVTRPVFVFSILTWPSASTPSLISMAFVW